MNKFFEISKNSPKMKVLENIEDRKLLTDENK